MVKKLLARYRAKRDFEKTGEPSGTKRVKASKRLRFVIQKHAASRLHYDLRLEIDGVFKSWAVTKGPSLDPADKRLAVEVEDHPLDYGDFEGTIPKGQYGGGTVMLWDRGYWECEDPQQSYRKGKLDFTLEGDKLSGGWILTRMRPREGEKRTNWLLIKHRDGASREGSKNTILENDRSVASGRSMDEIAEGKGKGPKPFMSARSREAARQGGLEFKERRCRRTFRGQAFVREASQTQQEDSGPRRPSGFHSTTIVYLRRSTAVARCVGP